MCFCHIVALKDSQKPGWQKAGDGGFGDMREVDEGRSGRGSAGQKEAHEGSRVISTPPCCLLCVQRLVSPLRARIRNSSRRHFNDDATHYCIYLFFLVPAVHQIRRHLPFIMCTLMDFKMTSAPEHLPPEYSVSTSLCLPVLGRRGGGGLEKKMHYARQEPS